MKGSFRKRGCTCPPEKKKCTCGATWSFRIDIGKDPATGKRRQKEAHGFRTRTEAEVAAAKLYTELVEGTYVAEKNITFKEFSEDWIEIYSSTGKVKTGSIRVRNSRLKRLNGYFSHAKMKDITRKMYQDMLLDLKLNGLAYETITSYHATCKLIFKKAVELEIIKSNPTNYSSVPVDRATVSELEEETEVPKYLEKEELQLFLETAKSKGLDKDYPSFLLLAYTGMRVGELCVLKWRDINFEDRTISITKTIDNAKNNTREYKIVPPKTKKSKRIIDVPELVIKELEAHRAHQNLFRMKHRDIYHDKDFIFAKEENYYGYPEMQKNIGYRLTRLLKLSRLNTSITPHSIRHTHTSLLAEAGVSLEAIMERLGHQNDITTREVYLHVTKKVKKEASKKFADLMNSF